MSISDPVKDSPFRNAGRATTLVSVGLLLALSAFTGCQPRAVTATVSYGPLGPVELPPGRVKMLLADIPTFGPASSGNHNPDAWPLEIRFSPGGKFSTIVAWPEVIVIDGQPRGTSDDSRVLADSLRQELLVGLSFPEAVDTCDMVRLTANDEPGLGLSLGAGQRETIGSLIQELSLKDPDSGYGGAPYPDYVLTLAWGGIPVRVEWTGREYVTLWSTGVYRALTWHDPEGKVWQACLSLLPPPSPDERQGLAKLFATTTAEVRASGGNLGQPVACGAWRVPILVRLLQNGQASSDTVPSGESVTVTFADTDHEWEVYLYEDGFLFEEQYYRLDDAEQTFLTTMNAG